MTFLKDHDPDCHHDHVKNSSRNSLKLRKRNCGSEYNDVV